MESYTDQIDSKDDGGDDHGNDDLLVLVTLASEAPVDDLHKSRLAKKCVHIVVLGVLLLFFSFLSHILSETGFTNATMRLRVLFTEENSFVFESIFVFFFHLSSS